jgi:hypothetical protein
MDDKVKVRWPIDGGPAARAGVKAGDEVSEIDDAALNGLGIKQVLDKLRGRAGTQVKLKIVRKDQAPIDVTIMRETIRIPGARIQVGVEDGQLVVAATERWSVLDFEKDKPIPVTATSSTEFRLEAGEHTRLAFVRTKPAGSPSSCSIPEDQGGEDLLIIIGDSNDLVYGVRSRRWE